MVYRRIQCLVKTGLDSAPDVPSPPRRRLLGGLLVRKEHWVLALPGKVLLLLALTLLTVVAVRGLYPFLALTHRVSGEILVVEGWIPTSCLEQVVGEYKSETHRQVIVARALYPGKSKYETGQYMADYMADSLVQYGIPKDRVHTVFLEARRRDRTYASAQAVKRWLDERGVSIRSVDVVTLGCHARRSRLLFEEAFGNKVSVGVIALEDVTYDPAHWWRYSAGVREVPSELTSYVYAKLFFSPE